MCLELEELLTSQINVLFNSHLQMQMKVIRDYGLVRYLTSKLTCTVFYSTVAKNRWYDEYPCVCT